MQINLFLANLIIFLANGLNDFILIGRQESFIIPSSKYNLTTAHKTNCKVKDYSLQRESDEIECIHYKEGEFDLEIGDLNEVIQIIRSHSNVKIFLELNQTLFLVLHQNDTISFVLLSTNDDLKQETMKVLYSFQLPKELGKQFQCKSIVQNYNSTQIILDCQDILTQELYFIQINGCFQDNKLYNCSSKLFPLNMIDSKQLLVCNRKLIFEDIPEFNIQRFISFCPMIDKLNLKNYSVYIWELRDELILKWSFNQKIHLSPIDFIQDIRFLYFQSNETTSIIAAICLNKGLFIYSFNFSSKIYTKTQSLLSIDVLQYDQYYSLAIYKPNLSFNVKKFDEVSMLFMVSEIYIIGIPITDDFNEKLKVSFLYNAYTLLDQNMSSLGKVIKLTVDETYLYLQYDFYDLSLQFNQTISFIIERQKSSCTKFESQIPTIYTPYTLRGELFSMANKKVLRYYENLKFQDYRVSPNYLMIRAPKVYGGAIGLQKQIIINNLNISVKLADPFQNTFQLKPQYKGTYDALNYNSYQNSIIIYPGDLYYGQGIKIEVQSKVNSPIDMCLFNISNGNRVDLPNFQVKNERGSNFVTYYNSYGWHNIYSAFIKYDYNNLLIEQLGRDNSLQQTETIEALDETLIDVMFIDIYYFLVFRTNDFILHLKGYILELNNEDLNMTLISDMLFSRELLMQILPQQDFTLNNNTQIYMQQALRSVFLFFTVYSDGIYYQYAIYYPFSLFDLKSGNSKFTHQYIQCILLQEVKESVSLIFKLDVTVAKNSFIFAMSDDSKLYYFRLPFYNQTKCYPIELVTFLNEQQIDLNFFVVDFSTVDYYQPQGILVVNYITNEIKMYYLINIQNEQQAFIYFPVFHQNLSQNTETKNIFLNEDINFKRQGQLNHILITNQFLILNTIEQNRTISYVYDLLHQTQNNLVGIYECKQKEGQICIISQSINTKLIEEHITLISMFISPLKNKTFEINRVSVQEQYSPQINISGYTVKQKLNSKEQSCYLMIDAVSDDTLLNKNQPIGIMAKVSFLFIDSIITVAESLRENRQFYKSITQYQNIFTKQSIPLDSYDFNGSVISYEWKTTDQAQQKALQLNTYFMNVKNRTLKIEKSNYDQYKITKSQDFMILYNTTTLLIFETKNIDWQLGNDSQEPFVLSIANFTLLLKSNTSKTNQCADQIEVIQIKTVIFQILEDSFMGTDYVLMIYLRIQNVNDSSKSNIPFFLYLMGSLNQMNKQPELFFDCQLTYDEEIVSLTTYFVRKIYFNGDYVINTYSALVSKIAKFEYPQQNDKIDIIYCNFSNISGQFKLESKYLDEIVGPKLQDLLISNIQTNEAQIFCIENCFIINPQTIKLMIIFQNANIQLFSYLLTIQYEDLQLINFTKTTEIYKYEQEDEFTYTIIQSEDRKGLKLMKTTASGSQIQKRFNNLTPDSQIQKVLRQYYDCKINIKFRLELQLTKAVVLCENELEENYLLLYDIKNETMSEHSIVEGIQIQGEIFSIDLRQSLTQVQKMYVETLSYHNGLLYEYFNYFYLQVNLLFLITEQGPH